ncbi:MAG: hypothetical protein JWR09_751 [Mucilaginibacter sp.]|nr:hypothetical protein [Mucilaginibacter sp.]
MENFKKLSKSEMKNVVGGVMKCCGHTADGAQSQCGLTMDAAKAWEMWCCASCQGPYNN